MKFLKLIFLMSLIGAMSFAVNAQSVELEKGKFMFQINGSTADSVTVNDTVLNIPVSVSGDNGSSFYYDLKAKIKKISGAGTVTVRLQGKKYKDDDYTNITTVKYYGNSTDTTIRFSQTSTKQFYNYYNLRVSIPTATLKTYPEYFKGYFKAQ